MGYEARMDAENEYIAERIREIHGSDGDAYTEDTILKLIETGYFDDAVIKRAKLLNYTLLPSLQRR